MRSTQMSSMEYARAIIKIISERTRCQPDEKSIDVIKKLLKHATIDVDDFDEGSKIYIFDMALILSYAIESRDIPVINLLIENGADVNFSASYCDLPLREAVKQANCCSELGYFKEIAEYRNIVKILLSTGADPNKVTSLELAEDSTPMMADKLGLIKGSQKEISIEKNIGKKTCVSEIESKTEASSIHKDMQNRKC